jgi:hypothetical protein
MSRLGVGPDRFYECISAARKAHQQRCGAARHGSDGRGVGQSQSSSSLSLSLSSCPPVCAAREELVVPLLFPTTSGGADVFIIPSLTNAASPPTDRRAVGSKPSQADGGQELARQPDSGGHDGRLASTGASSSFHALQVRPLLPPLPPPSDSSSSSGMNNQGRARPKELLRRRRRRRRHCRPRHCRPRPHCHIVVGSSLLRASS